MKFQSSKYAVLCCMRSLRGVANKAEKPFGLPGVHSVVPEETLFAHGGQNSACPVFHHCSPISCAWPARQHCLLVTVQHLEAILVVREAEQFRPLQRDRPTSGLVLPTQCVYSQS